MGSPTWKKKHRRFASTKRLSKSKNSKNRRHVKLRNDQQLHMAVENSKGNSKFVSCRNHIIMDHNYANLSNEEVNVAHCDDFMNLRSTYNGVSRENSDELHFKMYSEKEESLNSSNVMSYDGNYSTIITHKTTGDITNNCDTNILNPFQQMNNNKFIEEENASFKGVKIKESLNPYNFTAHNEYSSEPMDPATIKITANDCDPKKLNSLKQSECIVNLSDKEDDYLMLDDIFEALQSDVKTEVSENYAEDNREIINLNYFSDKLTELIINHMEVNECTIPLKCVERKRHGLESRFCYACSKCNFRDWISPDDFNNGQMGLNEAAVLGSINIGVGYTQLKELLASMDINCMNSKTYKRNMDILYQVISKCSLQSMIAAGVEEKRLALESNQLHNGIPWITVVIDGCWMTRSYGTNYDSLSGAAVIVGQRSGKVLFAGVRNKYCSTCEYEKRRGKEPTKHVCFKNWDRNAPSSGMESDIILEGFKCSMEMHGLIYKVLVSDGDSSVYKNITDNDVYNEYCLVPTRIRCYNHLLRNLCTKLNAVSKTTQQRGCKKIKNFVTLRNSVKDKILPIRKLVDLCVDYRRSEIDDLKYQKQELQKDIIAIPKHIFGDHSDCVDRAYINDDKCNDVKHEKEFIHMLKSAGLYEKIEESVETLSTFAESLLYKVTNNMAESYNSLVCVDIGGKRINFGLTCQYNVRVFAAVIKHNSQQLLTEVYQYICSQTPQIVKDLDMKRQIKISRNRESRRLYGRKRKFSSKKNKNKYYGNKSQQVDLPEEELKELETIHFKKLRENQEIREAIEERTRDQSESMEWICLRKKLLTASHFASVICSKEDTSCAQKVKNILYPSLTKTPGMQYGKEHEGEAIATLEKVLNVKILKSGLYIDSVHPYLACTPDGKIGHDGIVEVKTSLKAENLSAEEAIKTVKHLKTLFKMENNVYKMNERHNYYYQVQGQLHITQRAYCIFAFWTPKSVLHVRVEKDDLFWKDKMENLLHRFYMKCMLPEILDSRWNRSMPLREPSYILQAKEIKLKQIAERSKSIASKRQVQTDTVILKKRKDVSEKMHVNNSKFASSRCSGEDDIEITKVNLNYEWTLDDISSVLTFIEDREILLNEIVKIISNVKTQLNDDCLDAFMRVISQNKTLYYVQSVLFISYPQLVEPLISGKGIAIIGGSCTNHWRVAYYDGCVIKIYDTLISATEGNLHYKERLYLNLRFPKVSSIILQKMSMQQPDGVSCGVYAAAIVCDIVLGIDPSLSKYSTNITEIRKHFIHILKTGKLSTFPKQ